MTDPSTSLPDSSSDSGGPTPALPRLLLRPEEAAGVLGVGRTKVFELLGTGQLDSIMVGPGSRRIPWVALEEYVERARRDAGPGTTTPGADRAPGHRQRRGPDGGPG